MTKLAFEVGLRLEDLVAASAQPHKNLRFYAVGYGMTELLDKGSNSGGPLFYQTTSGPVEVGVTSSGDAMCRSTQTSSRMDVETAAWFVTCARAHPGNVTNCGF